MDSAILFEIHERVQRYANKAIFIKICCQYNGGSVIQPIIFVTDDDKTYASL